MTEVCMKADKDSPLGQALDRVATKALEGRPDVLHQARVDLIELALDARDDAYEDVMVQLPPELHEPVHKAITKAVVQTLGALDSDYVVLPNVAYRERRDSPAAFVVVPLADGHNAVDSKAFNVAGDLAVIFSTIYDDVNN